MPFADGKYISEAALTALPDLPAVEWLYASGCTAVAALPDLPAVKWLDVSGCTALTALPDLPAVETLDATGCTALTTLPDLPAVECLEARGIHTHVNKHHFFAGPIGSRNAWLIVRRETNKITVRAGCFFGDIDTFKQQVDQTHGGNIHGENYRAIIRIIRDIWSQPLNEEAS